ncbi:MAG: amino acid adenylation domain-containing protein [Actinocatenispora sp.]
MMSSRPQDPNHSPVGADAPFPLTPLQQAYWVGRADALELGGIDAHEYFAFDCTDLDLDRAVAALRRLVQCHDILRVVVTPDGQQTVLSTAEPRVTVEDLRGLPADEVDSRVGEVTRHLATTGPDPSVAPMVDVIVQRLDGGRDRAHVSIGFVIADGLTQHALVEDWIALYRDPGHHPGRGTAGYREVVTHLLTEAVADADPDRDWEYWRARVGSLAPAPELPVLDRVPPSGARFTRRVARLDPDRWRAFQRHAETAGVTREAALLTAYAEVLAHWSKQQNFTLLVLSSFRSPDHPGSRTVLGNLGGTVPVEVDCRDQVGFADRARAVQAQLSTDLAHGSVDGVRIARETARAQGWSARAVFPVVFAGLLDVDTSFLDTPPFPVEVVDSALQTPQVHLDHQVYEYGGGLVSNWDTVDAVFCPGFIESAFRTYRTLLAALTDEQGWHRPVTVSGLLPRSAEIEPVDRLLTLDPAGLLHTPFFTMADEAPDRLALVAGETRLTYGELAARSAAVGSWLVDRGVRPGMLLPVVAEKGWEQVVAVLGVMYAGAAYLPIDAALPAARIAYLLDRATPGVGLTQSWVAEGIDLPGDRSWLSVDHVPTAPDAPVSVCPRQRPDDTAYVIYTSGSTGEPKGVEVTHQSAVNTVADVTEVIGLGSDDVVLGLSLLSFDLSVFDIFGTLAAGGVLVFPGRDQLREPEHWAELASTEKVTIWNSVPALMEILVDHIESSDPARTPLSLRSVLLSGDWIPVTLPERIRGLWSGAEVISMGGATEGSIWSIMYRIGAVDPTWRSIPYGQAMTNQRMYVLDGNREPRPEWATGEIAIGGVGVARGYWQDEARTADRFVRHDGTGTHLYRTGDLGRVLPDGTIELLGRDDLQVKVNGYRVELGEIESALQRVDGVRDAVAVVRSASTSGKALAAYVVPADTARPPDGEGLRLALAGTLPPYMVPSLIQTVAAVPLTPNGKVDRKQLATLLPDHGPGGTGARRAPADEVEATLVTLFAQVLGIDELGVEDDFFVVGGNSFLAIRLLTAVTREFGVEVPVASLFGNATPAHVAEIVRTDRRGGLRAESGGVPVLTLRRGSGRPLFLVHPVGGAASCYTELSLRLPVGRPVYGLESVGLRTDEPPLTTIEEMAAAYLERVRAIQPIGPYLIGGWSMGGLIALEMARQLGQKGELVSRLVVVDAVLPAADAPVDELTERAVLTRMVQDLTGEVGVRPDLDAVTDRAAVFGHLRARGVLPAETPESSWRRLAEVYAANLRALARYRPDSCPGPVLLVQATARPAGTASPADSWSRAGADCVVETVAGDHYTMWQAAGLDAIVVALGDLLR